MPTCLASFRRQPNVVGIQDRDNAVTLILDRNAFLTKRRLEPNTKAYDPCPLEDIARGFASRYGECKQSKGQLFGALAGMIGVAKAVSSSGSTRAGRAVFIWL